MARLLLHIGLHHTGGGDFQARFARNRALLESHGLHYPDIGPTEGHHPLAALWLDMRALPRSYLDATDVEALWRELSDRYARAPGTLVLSAEALSRAAPDRVDFADLARRVAGFESVRLVCALRPQPQMIGMLLAQAIRDGAAVDPAAAVARALDSGLWRGVGLDYEALYRRITQGFAPEQIVLLDDLRLRAEPLGLERTVLKLAGCDLPVERLALPRAEPPSPPPLAWELARQVAPGAAPEAGLAQAIAAGLYEMEPGETSALAEAEYDACLARFAPGNARLPGGELRWRGLPRPRLFRDTLTTQHWLAVTRALYLGPQT